VLDVARFWLALGVDGFRLDTANYYFHDRALHDNPPQPPERRGDCPAAMQLHVHNICQPENLDFLARIRQVLDAHGERMAVAEIGSADNLARMIEYTHGDARLHTAYSFVLLGDRPTPARLADLMAPWQDVVCGGDHAWPSWALSNHDVPRVATRWAGNEAQQARVCMALLASLRGTLFVYQGEELGLPQAELAYDDLRDPIGKAQWPRNKGRDGCRTPMPWEANAPAAGFTTGKPWLPLSEPHRALAVDVQEASPDSMLHFTRQVLALRRAHCALRRGSFTTLHADDQVLVALRVHEGDAVLVAFNLSDAPRIVELAQPPKRTGAAVSVGEVRLDGSGLALGPWSAWLVAVQA
jgi:alpha-glucosidase